MPSACPICFIQIIPARVFARPRIRLWLASPDSLSGSPEAYVAASLACQLRTANPPMVRIVQPTSHSIDEAELFDQQSISHKEQNFCLLDLDGFVEARLE